jgi:multiple sugar transport system permease protein
MKKGNSIKLKIAVIISIIITIFWLLPYIYVICCSFKPGSEVIAVPPSFLPKSFSVENFTQLFVRMNAGGYLLNSLITAVCSTIIAVILGSLAFSILIILLQLLLSFPEQCISVQTLIKSLPGS